MIILRGILFFAIASVIVASPIVSRHKITKRADLSQESRALYNEIKALLATDDSDDVKFNKFKVLLAQATSDLLDKLAIDPPNHLTSSEEHQREKRAARKKGKKGKGKRWFRVLVEAGW